ncbi:MAG: hypothetical protein ACXVHX_16865 [Solirubrobacteraceae bacterium]
MPARLEIRHRTGNNVERTHLLTAHSTFLPPSGNNVEREARKVAHSTNFPAKSRLSSGSRASLRHRTAR